MSVKKRGKELSALEQGSLIVILAVVFLLSVTAISNLLNSGNLTADATSIQNIIGMEGGKDIFFEVRDVKGMQYADIQLLSMIKGGQIIFNDNVPVDFSGKIFNSFTISSRDSSNLGAVTFTLKIKTADLLLVGINIDEVKLYVNGKETDTVKTSTQGLYTYYTAKLDHFENGNYVIGVAEKKKEIAKPAKPVQPTDKVAENKPAGTQQEQQPQVPAPSVGQAIQPNQNKQGFFNSIADFFRKFFGSK